MARPWLHVRKNLIKKAMRKHGRRKFVWIGGVLYFTNTRTAVPGIPHVPKAGRPAIGLAAHNKKDK